MFAQNSLNFANQLNLQTNLIDHDRNNDKLIITFIKLSKNVSGGH